MEDATNGRSDQAVFTIAPLEWKHYRPAGHHPDGEYWEAWTVFGPIYTYGNSWSCTVDEFYDENGGAGDDSAHAMRLAEEWYHGRLMPALSAVIQ
jgi:hypothetical protein